LLSGIDAPFGATGTLGLKLAKIADWVAKMAKSGDAPLQ